jgi:hypothetical protein
MNAQSDEQVRNLFAEEDKSKILKIERWGQNKVAQFKTVEERDAAMERLPDEVKNRAPGQEDRSKPLVKIFSPPSSRQYSRGGAGNWGSSRGGRDGGNAQSGYRSAGGGGASDSEGAGRRGGRGGGRGGRGGERGRGRGPRGGAKGEGAASPAPAAES